MAKKAKTLVPKTLAEVEELERAIAQKLLAIEAAELDAAKRIGDINGALAITLGPLTEEVIALAKLVRAFAEEHKNTLTENGKHTLAALGTNGSVQWSKLPASLKITTNATEVIAHLKRLRLSRFVRKVEEVDKDALLKEPLIAAKVPGVSISSGEKFYLRLVGVRRRLDCALGNNRWTIFTPKRETKE